MKCWTSVEDLNEGEKPITFDQVSTGDFFRFVAPPTPRDAGVCQKIGELKWLRWSRVPVEERSFIAVFSTDKATMQVTRCEVVITVK